HAPYDHYSCRTDVVLATTFFFFQAEDGIRDRNVTGVQTCALPISLESWGIRPETTGHGGTGKHIFSHIEWHMTALTVETALETRSEERRVGKEGRSGWGWRR